MCRYLMLPMLVLSLLSGCMSSSAVTVGSGSSSHRYDPGRDLVGTWKQRGESNNILWGITTLKLHKDGRILDWPGRAEDDPQAYWVVEGGKLRIIIPGGGYADFIYTVYPDLGHGVLIVHREVDAHVFDRVAP